MNILFITTDQQRADTIGAYGSTVCRTPHIDRIAAAGMRFDRAYTNHPLCQPSRATIVTGRLPSRHGVFWNGVDIPDETVPTLFPSVLADEGWDTAFCGKAHFSSLQTFEPTPRPENLAGSGGYDADWDGPYMGFGWNRLVLGGHYPATTIQPPQGMHYAAHVFRDGTGRGQERVAAMAPASNLAPHVDAPETWYPAVDWEDHQTHFTGESAVSFLRGRAASERPFFLWASFADPHHPFDPPAPFAGTYDAADVTPPPEPTEEELDAKPPFQRAWAENSLGIPSYFNPGWLGMTDRQRRQMMAAYYDMVAGVDHEVGRILDVLDDTGLADETLVVFSTDHGELLGDHGCILKGPIHYESLVRVPLLMSGPGITAGSVHSGLTCHADLASTFLDAAGVADPHERDGHSLVGALGGRGGPERDCVVVENDMPEWGRAMAADGGRVESLRTIVTETTKLTCAWDDAPQLDVLGELYLLDEDPAEMTNRWDDPAVAVLKADLLDRLVELQPARALHGEVIGLA